MKKNILSVLIIGAGQSGLTIASYLKEAGIPFLLVDQSKRIGDSWRNRYDSLSLLTPLVEDSLPGMSLNGDPMSFPTKDEMADYLEQYARHFSFPINLNTRVIKLSKENDLFTIKTNKGQYMAKEVIVATGPFQRPFIPNIPDAVPRRIFQIHSQQYKNTRQIPKGRVLVVGAGNSGAQIAMELANTHDVTLSTKRKLIFSSKYDFLYRVIAKVFKVEAVRKIVDAFTVRKVFVADLEELIKSKKIVLKQELKKIEDGKFFFKDKSSAEFDVVVWATGFQFDYSWITLKNAFNKQGDVLHKNGASFIPGLYFVYPEEAYGFIRDLPKLARLREEELVKKRR